MKTTQTSSKKVGAKASPKSAVKKASAAPAKTSTKKLAMGNRKAAVRNSAIHGHGVVALVAIASGERICEYKGERIGWPEALRRHPHDPEQPFHTFYFSLDDGSVIDGNVDGDFSRFINHSCEPNCEAEMIEGKNGMRVFIHALRDIASGEELVYNYGLTLDERYTPTLKKQFACYCGSARCRGTMLSPKR